VWLFATGPAWKGVTLILWSVLVVATVDNLLRPLLIGGQAQISFLWLLFGVLGGAAAFGLLGLFVGPVVLAVLLAVWREWAAEPEITAANPVVEAPNTASGPRGLE
jgi:predicted PurR-regulated permease PerM